MKSVRTMIELAGGLATFESINIPGVGGKMPLLIQPLGKGPTGKPLIRVEHWGERNGDRMSDPEIQFEIEIIEQEDRWLFRPCYYCQHYLGIAHEFYEKDEKGHVRWNWKRIADANEFIKMWDENLKEYVEAYRKQRLDSHPFEFYKPLMDAPVQSETSSQSLTSADVRTVDKRKREPVPQDEVIHWLESNYPEMTYEIDRAWVWIVADLRGDKNEETRRKLKDYGFRFAKRGHTVDGGVAHWGHSCEAPIPGWRLKKNKGGGGPDPELERRKEQSLKEIGELLALL